MNVLLVSIAFPPKRDPEALQVARYVSALAATGEVQIDVVTSAVPTLAMPADEGLRRYMRGYRQLLEVDFFESRYVNYALQKIRPGLLQRPDSRFRFWRNWKAAARALRTRPEVVYSRSFPLSSALMGYHLARHFDVPWVMHLSDPWTVSPLHASEHAPAWNEDAEAMCFHAAAAITLTSQKTVDLYAAKYPQHAGKFHIFPNVYEEEAVSPNPWSSRAKLLLVYTGSLIGTRTAAPVINALRRLQQERPEVRRDVDVVFAGLCDPRNAALLARNDVGIQYLGNIPMHKAVGWQRDADVLLLIDSAFERPEHAVFFPSKLLDYIAAQRRTIGITDRDSASWQVMGQLALGDRVTHGDVDGLCAAIVSARAAWKRGDRDYFERSSRASELEAGYNAARLIELFRAIAGRGPDVATHAQRRIAPAIATAGNSDA